MLGSDRILECLDRADFDSGSKEVDALVLVVAHLEATVLPASFRNVVQKEPGNLGAAASKVAEAEAEHAAEAHHDPKHGLRGIRPGAGIPPLLDLLRAIERLAEGDAGPLARAFSGAACYGSQGPMSTCIACSISTIKRPRTLSTSTVSSRHTSSISSSTTTTDMGPLV